MYQIVRLSLLVILLFVEHSSQSSDLPNYPNYHSSNQEISYFIHYLDNLFHILDQTLDEYRVDASNVTDDYAEYAIDSEQTELKINSTCFNHLKHTVEMARKESPWAIQSKLVF